MPRRGFVAILSVIIISGVALVTSAGLTAAFFSQSSEIFDRASASQANLSALSCADIALLRLKMDTGYSGNENISIDNVVCTIEAVVSSADARTIYARASVNGTRSRVRVSVADVNQLFVTSWTEIGF